MLRALANWKTTVPGVLSLIVYFLGPMFIWPDHKDFWDGLAVVLFSLGLIAARQGGNGSDQSGGGVERGTKTPLSNVPVGSSIMPPQVKP